jgi:hypothetical protein
MIMRNMQMCHEHGEMWPAEFFVAPQFSDLYSGLDETGARDGRDPRAFSPPQRPPRLINSVLAPVLDSQSAGAAEFPFV